MKRVRDIIRGQVLEKVPPGELIMQALQRMETKLISALLVFDRQEFVGIVTVVDIAHSGHGQAGGEVKDIMTPAKKVKFIGQGATLHECAVEMKKAGHIHHLPVKDSNGEVVGIVSSLDLINAREEEREDAAESAGDMPAS